MENYITDWYLYEEYTKEIITLTDLGSNGIFVFGSNTSGRHGAGAAKAAVPMGAEYGLGEGESGKTYALPTLKYEDNVLVQVSLLELTNSIHKFVQHATENTDKKYYLTKIGTGLAGWSLSTVCMAINHVMANIDWPSNIILPKEFYEGVCEYRKQFFEHVSQYFPGISQADAFLNVRSENEKKYLLRNDAGGVCTALNGVFNTDGQLYVTQSYENKGNMRYRRIQNDSTSQLAYYATSKKFVDDGMFFEHEVEISPRVFAIKQEECDNSLRKYRYQYYNGVITYAFDKMIGGDELSFLEVETIGYDPIFGEKLLLDAYPMFIEHQLAMDVTGLKTFSMKNLANIK